MKINEFTSKLNTYIATVRVVLRGEVTTARTTVMAETLQQAKLMLTRIYGYGNVLHINQMMAEDEEVTEATKTLSPEELQIKSLRDKAQQYKDQADGVKARYSLTKAKERLNSYNYNQSRK